MLNTKLVIVDGDEIKDEVTFHSEFKFKLGLPSFYGANMDALIDSLSYLDDKTCNQSKYWQLGKNENMIISIKSSSVFRDNCLEVFMELLDVITATNERYESSKSSTRILLQLE
ncbi:barstar family protein [Teredinibacter turnerae]|uniref:barstar family protein n=1 Tax=Teredinibacter turnerae TaxID=2426 RepID=UPI0006862181